MPTIILYYLNPIKALATFLTSELVLKDSSQLQVVALKDLTPITVKKHDKTVLNDTSRKHQSLPVLDSSALPPITVKHERMRVQNPIFIKQTRPILIPLKSK